MTAIITTGAQVENMDTIDGKIYVEPFIDGDLVMKQCDLVVCHGGNGTIYQALQHGKPIIGIPTIPDQKFNMRRVKALGIGKTLKWSEFIKKPELLADLINSILNNRMFYTNASKIQQILKSYDSTKIAANIIEDYLRTKSI